MRNKFIFINNLYLRNYYEINSSNLNLITFIKFYKKNVAIIYLLYKTYIIIWFNTFLS